MPDFRDILLDPRRVTELSPTEAATALVELATLQAAVAARLRSTPSGDHAVGTAPEADRLLTAEDVAERLNRSVDWVYRHARHWPFTRRLARRTLRFSEAGLHRFLTQRRAFAP
jgi:hypothetical protein